MESIKARFAAALIAACGCAVSSAEVATQLEATVTNPVTTYGAIRASGWITVILKYDGGPCPSSLERVPGTLFLRRDGVPIDQQGFLSFFHRSCENGKYTAGQDFVLANDADFGDHAYVVEYSGAPGFQAATSNTVTATSLPAAQSSAPDGSGVISMGAAGVDAWLCEEKQLALAPALSQPPPTGVRFPFGIVRYDLARCFYQCGFLCPPGTPTTPRHKLLVEHPGTLPASARVWTHDGTSWQPSTTLSIVDDVVRGEISGSPGSGRISGAMAVGVPDSTPQFEDLWWAGEAENGWGLAIAQNGDRLFLVLFIYDDAGHPQWLVMSGGRWNASRTTWEGDFHRPSGAWHPQFEASDLRIGAPVGTGRFTVNGPLAGQFEYVIDGVSGTKAMKRQIFVPQGSATPGRYAGLWWGGAAESGWGITVAHQEDTLFAVWYTYDQEGRGAWYFMPGGTWTATDRFAGALYKASGPPWLGARYEPGRFFARAVGTLAFTFTATGAATLDYSLDGATGRESLTRQPF